MTGGASPVAPTLEIGCADGDQVITREAVRAVAVDDLGRILLLHSRVGGDYKFPGGGVEEGEDPRAALARELDEECGSDLLAMGELLVSVVERRAAREAPAVFQMRSRYYQVAVGTTHRTQRLEEYEAALGLRPVWVSPAAAIAANESALAGPDPAPWVDRELRVLRWLHRPSGRQARSGPG